MFDGKRFYISWLHCSPLYVSVSQWWRLFQKNVLNKRSFREDTTTSEQSGWKVCFTSSKLNHHRGDGFLNLTFGFIFESRMRKDGRQPQTFRLTIRKYTTTNKWFSRESRQCPIPNHIGQKISSGMLTCQGELRMISVEVLSGF